MPSFLIDEDLPRSMANALRSAGYSAFDARDVGLRGRGDADVFVWAQEHGLVVVKVDQGFAKVLPFPLGGHAGLIVLRVPDTMSPAARNRGLLRALADLQGIELKGLLVMVEVGRHRIRGEVAPSA